MEEIYNNQEMNVENTENQPVEQIKPAIESSNEPKCSKNKAGNFSMLLSIIVAIAVVVLFVLHFTQPAKNNIVKANNSSLQILTVNNDSLVKHFVLVDILKSDLEAETEKFTKDWEGKAQSFQVKLNNYQINVQNQVLTATQMQNAERELTKEKESLDALQERYTTILANKEISVQKEIMDSIMNATNRVNARYGADYVIATSLGSAIICANPEYDITNEVIKELNDSYKKTHK